MNHAHAVTHLPGFLLDSIIADLSKRNLRDYRDHEIRWSAERLRAARAERKRRKSRTTPTKAQP